MIRKPSPSRAATSSAEMTEVQARPKMIFSPLRICGRLPGRTTSRITCQPLAPQYCASRISTRSTLCLASISQNDLQPAQNLRQSARQNHFAHHLPAAGAQVLCCANEHRVDIARGFDDVD